MASNPSLLPEIGPDGLAREAPVISYTEKIIEEGQLQLRKYIEENYTKIRDVERELSNLTMEMKLTAGPKKAALEHLRKKIEISTEKIRVAKLKEEQARKVWEEASKAVKDEEEIKQKLCEDLNKLVQESSNAQFARLEELKRRLEALNPRTSISSAHDRTSGPAQTNAATDITSGATTADSGATVAHDQGSVKKTPAVTGNNQNPAAEARSKKKKIPMQGRGIGLGAIAKSRGSQASGWTGAGFDADGRT